MGDLPTGTVTFLFTDIEDSTRLAAAMGDEAWAEVLEWHHGVIRHAVGQNDGVEFGTEGDACFVAFPAASGALAAAVAAQRDLALGESTVRVRMGLHSGEALVRGANYVGHTLRFAKRVCDVGHGGQILLSAAAAELVGTHLPPSVTVLDLGRHRLKDLGESQSIREAVDARRPSSFPPLRTLDASPNNLPSQRTALVGRSREVARVSGMLDASRLVTLTGIGGCGKTRLALAVAAERADVHPGGLFFVDLAPVGDPEAIATTVATAFGLSEGGGSVAPINDQIDGFLSSRKCLIVFDNCEHMLDDCADWVERLLGVGSGVAVIATSREALSVDGEQAFQVPSLSISTDAGSATSDAVVLFVDRASAVDPSFTLTPDVVGSVVEITRRLDGIPLAIELAAARISHLTPAEIAARLDDMFHLLTGGRRRVQRQQTLKAALDWSYELLIESERQLLQRLSVFSGGAHLDAVEAVCSDPGDALDLDRGAVLDMLGSLVAKSFVIAQRSGEHVRYHLLETVRQYAADELRAHGSPDVVRARHLEHYCKWLDSIPPVERYFDNSTWALVDGELDNLRSAMAWSVEQGRPELAAHIASRMFTLGVNLYGEEARRWLVGGLERLDVLEPLDRQDVLAALATADMLAGDGDPVTLARRAVAVDLGDTQAGGAACVAHVLLSMLLAAQAQAPAMADRADESRAAGVQALDIAGRLAEDDSAWTAWAWQGRGNGDLLRGDMAGAARAYERAIQDWTASRCNHPGYVARLGLAIALHIAGDDRRATAAVDAMDALDLAAPQQLSRRPGEQTSWTPMARALTLAGAGDLAGARATLADALRSLEASPNRSPDATLIIAAVVALEIGDFERASRLLAAAISFDLRPGRTFFIRSQWGFALHRHYLPIVRASLAPDVARRCRAEGAAMSLPDAMAHAWELTTV